MWVASIQRIVPERERMTRVCVSAPPPKKRRETAEAVAESLRLLDVRLGGSNVSRPGSLGVGGDRQFHIPFAEGLLQGLLRQSCHGGRLNFAAF